eukprot:TRINITY_DN4920_c0_g1_i13.p1 TRINITY_DN4920_c0_g1~~TRINITY_DN4920_c0_g1_i13.p1  ORF type:complete len:863 (-),score=135.49 TRINITY_DN4920_c0_g1_i13:198-2786(-)
MANGGSAQLRLHKWLCTWLGFAMALSQSFEKVPHKNCYAGHGATPIAGSYHYVSLSHGECQNKCQETFGCQGFVVHNGANSAEGNCWLLKDMNIAACDSNPDYDVWIAGGHADYAAPMSSRPAPGFQKFPYKNCYTDHGATPIPGSYHFVSLSHGECQNKCQETYGCQGLVVHNGAMSAQGHCWLLKDMNIAACESNPDYDVWIAEGHAEQPVLPIGQVKIFVGASSVPHKCIPIRSDAQCNSDAGNIGRTDKDPAKFNVYHESGNVVCVRRVDSSSPWGIQLTLTCSMPPAPQKGPAGSWASAKAQWCCMHQMFSLGCPYDCAAGLGNWQRGWSDDKKRWCCENQRLGCTGALPPSRARSSLPPYNCNVGDDAHREPPEGALVDVVIGNNGGSGSNVKCITSSVPVRCSSSSMSLAPRQDEFRIFQKNDVVVCAEYLDVSAPWEMNLVLKCQKATGWTYKGGQHVAPDNSESADLPSSGGTFEDPRPHSLSPPHGSSARYNCYHGSQEMWTQEKAQYCIIWMQAGGSSRVSKYDCSIGSPSVWPKDKSNWCDLHGGKYDCSKGTSSSWSQDEFNYCCIVKNYGCPAPTDTGPSVHQYAEDNEFRNKWEDGAALDEVDPSTGTHRLDTTFDCLENKHDDTDYKEKWCCQRWGLKCSKDYSTDDIGFDCDAGLWNWQKGWSDKKKSWCCEHRRKGCVETGSTTAAVRIGTGNTTAAVRIGTGSTTTVAVRVGTGNTKAAVHIGHGSTTTAAVRVGTGNTTAAVHIGTGSTTAAVHSATGNTTAAVHIGAGSTTTAAVRVGPGNTTHWNWQHHHSGCARWNWKHKSSCAHWTWQHHHSGRACWNWKHNSSCTHWNWQHHSGCAL